jgi:SAM-dependent methyltransferase
MSLVERAACPGCGAAGARVLYEAPYEEPALRDYLAWFYPGFEPELVAGETYRLERCVGCGLRFQRLVPDEVLAARLYGGWIDLRASFEREDSLGYYAAAAQEAMVILAWLGRRPSELRVLDYGMGWGKWARMAGAFGCEAYGVEIQPEAAAYAARHGIRVLERGDLEPRMFDAVNTEQVLEHVLDPRETLADLRRALRPGGLVKVSVPDCRGIERRLRDPDWRAPKGSSRSLNPVAPLEHVNGFDRRSLVAVARAAGLEPVRIPLGVQYAAATGWRLPRGFARNLVKPLVRNTLSRRPYVFLRASASSR